MNKAMTMLWLRKYPECRLCANIDIGVKHYKDYQIITECVNKLVTVDNDEYRCMSFSRKEKK